MMQTLEITTPLPSFPGLPVSSNGSYSESFCGEGGKEEFPRDMVQDELGLHVICLPT